MGGTDFHYIAKTNAEEGQLIAGNICSLCLSDLPTYAFFFFFFLRDEIMFRMSLIFFSFPFMSFYSVEGNVFI